MKFLIWLKKLSWININASLSSPKYVYVYLGGERIPIEMRNKGNLTTKYYNGEWNRVNVGVEWFWETKRESDGMGILRSDDFSDVNCNNILMLYFLCVVLSV